MESEKYTFLNKPTLLNPNLEDYRKLFRNFCFFMEKNSEEFSMKKLMMEDLSMRKYTEL